MQVSSQANSFAAMNAYQQPVQPTLPKPEYNSRDVYEASNGNMIAGKDGGLALTPQGELNARNKRDAKVEQTQEEEQAKKDEQRGLAVDYLESQSKKSRAEIYLSVSHDSKESSLGSTANIISSLRDVQKQNNAVQAYATYQENQNNAHLF